MNSTFNNEYSVSLADSLAFSRLSGDYNLLHVDPVLARRTQFGGTVTHGIHLFLRALDELAARGLFERMEPATLSAAFHNPVLTGATISMRTSVNGSRVRISAETNGKPAFTGTIELKPASNNAVAIEDAEFAVASAQEAEFPPILTEGTVPLKLKRAQLSLLFPSLVDVSSMGWIADLLATTQIVGMRCPGLHSIYSGFKVRCTQPAGISASMRYLVNGMDRRFQLVRIQIMGACLVGTIEAFFRVRPISQLSMKEVILAVPRDAFANHRVLVIGGSRGLGELTAKIVAAGGAEVTITYARGREDAERVCAEVHALGCACTTHHLDVTGNKQSAPEWLARSLYSHVYFFASPLISKNAGPWNESLFRQFTDVYVTAFATLINEILTSYSNKNAPVRFLYPSSIFVTQPEPGFVEYAVAKAAGETLCDQLQTRCNARFVKPRLPRMRTDQTNSLVDIGAVDPFPIILDVVRNFHYDK